MIERKLTKILEHEENERTSSQKAIKGGAREEKGEKGEGREERERREK